MRRLSKADLKKVARKYIAGGFSVIPVTSSKNPAVAKWGQFQARVMKEWEITKYFKDAFGIGLLCGGKWRVVGLDFDLKYDLTGTLWERFREKLPNKIASRMWAQTTKNGGYHLVFKAPATKLVGNEKLACRETTAYERDKTYRESFDDPETRDKATKIADNDRSRVLIETRSGTKEAAGGYIVIAPTEGYKPLGGKIGELTEEEYDLVMELARSFNEVRDTHNKGINYNYNEEWKRHPYDHYNEEGDILEELLKAGWRIVEESGRNVRLKRPGQVHSTSSALLDKESGVFNCFSTSTIFDVNKAYSATSVYSILNCDGSMGQAYKKLIEMGYGEK
jgi:hypothetical protein